MQLLLECVAVATMTVIVGSMVGFLIAKFHLQLSSNSCKDWNKNHIMESSLFVTGFLIHILCEHSGVNRWYCKNGHACAKKDVAPKLT
jgi:membrane protein YqaA with SNARE-associated domain